MVVGSTTCWSNLAEMKVREMIGRKRGAFLTSGIFHTPGKAQTGLIKGLRYSSSQLNDGHERIVLVFKENNLPRVYGSLKGQEVFLDFFQTQKKELDFSKIKTLLKQEFIPINDKMLSLKLTFKEPITLEPFFLENPGRLVLDVKPILKKEEASGK